MNEIKEPATIVLTAEFAQQLMDYLVSRPYAETFLIINELQKQSSATLKGDFPPKSELDEK